MHHHDVWNVIPPRGIQSQKQRVHVQGLNSLHAYRHLDVFIVKLLLYFMTSVYDSNTFPCSWLILVVLRSIVAHSSKCKKNHVQYTSCSGSLNTGNRDIWKTSVCRM